MGHKLDAHQNSSSANSHPESTMDMNIWGTLFVLATCFTILSLVVSIHSIAKHLEHFNAPRYQLYICRLLLMVPIYVGIFVNTPNFPVYGYYSGLL